MTTQRSTLSLTVLALIMSGTSLVARADQWQDIATAPIDGTDILVCVTYNLSADEWETKIWVDWQVPTERWPVYWGKIDVPFPPTHWMPLPSPPAIRSNNKAGERQ